MFFQFRLPHKELKEGAAIIALLVIIKSLLTVLNITIVKFCGQIKRSKGYLYIFC